MTAQYRIVNVRTTHSVLVHITQDLPVEEVPNSSRRLCVGKPHEVSVEYLDGQRIGFTDIWYLLVLKNGTIGKSVVRGFVSDGQDPGWLNPILAELDAKYRASADAPH